MPETGSEMIPGGVLLPTWAIVSTIATLAGVIGYLGRYLLGTVDRQATALAENTAAQEAQAHAAELKAARLEALERRLGSVEIALGSVLKIVEKCDGRP